MITSRMGRIRLPLSLHSMTRQCPQTFHADITIYVNLTMSSHSSLSTTAACPCLEWNLGMPERQNLVRGVSSSKGVLERPIIGAQDLHRAGFHHWPNFPSTLLGSSNVDFVSLKAGNAVVTPSENPCTIEQSTGIQGQTDSQCNVRR